MLQSGRAGCCGERPCTVQCCDLLCSAVHSCLHTPSLIAPLPPTTNESSDLRDAALDEAADAKGELRRLRTAHEELLVCSREAAARASVEHSELLGELKLKGFELSRLQVRHQGGEERAARSSTILYCAVLYCAILLKE